MNPYALDTQGRDVHLELFEIAVVARQHFTADGDITATDLFCAAWCDCADTFEVNAQGCLDPVVSIVDRNLRIDRNCDKRESYPLKN